jgi:hypothetical protein
VNAATYTISGRVMFYSLGSSGVTVSAGVSSTTTDANGYYTLSGLPNGSYTVTPTKSGGYNHTPASRPVTISGANVTGQDFSSGGAYGIYGSVTMGGTGVSGVGMSVVWLAGTSSGNSAANGSYGVYGFPNGTYTVTPSKAGYAFSPTSISATISGGDATGKNFTATMTSPYCCLAHPTYPGAPESCSATDQSGGTISCRSVSSCGQCVGPVGPTITTQPSAVTVNVGQTAAFSVSVSGTLPISYQWQKNGANISGATSASYTTPATTASDNGATFRCVVSNDWGTVTSSAATLTVSAGAGAYCCLVHPTYPGQQGYCSVTDQTGGSIGCSARSCTMGQPC